MSKALMCLHLCGSHAEKQRFRVWIRDQVDRMGHLDPQASYRFTPINEDHEAIYRQVMAKCKTETIGFITCFDAAYPDLLLRGHDFPLVLFYLGNVDRLLDQHKLAIIGTRKPTYDAKKITDQVARYLQGKSVTIVSGLAIGVDALAHKRALDYQVATIAVLASGLDQITPHSHSALAKAILDAQGLIVSEYPPGFTLQPFHFVERNRIVTGISQKVFIVEAGLKSGSLTSANFAIEQGKDLYVMPGSISNPVAKGTNALLREGALPVIEPEDLGYDTVPEYSIDHPIIDLLTLNGPMLIQDLAHTLNMDQSLLIFDLLDLEIMGKLIQEDQVIKLT